MIRWLWTVLAVTMWNGAWMTITAPVDHGRERPAKRCLLEKVTKEAELHLDESKTFQECLGRNMELHFLSLVFASPIFTNHVVLPSVHLSIRPSMSVYSTHSPCLYTVYVHRTSTHQRTLGKIRCDSKSTWHLYILPSVHNIAVHHTHHNSNRTLSTAHEWKLQEIHDPCTCKVRSTTRIHHPSVCGTSQQAQRHRSYYRYPPGKICRLFGHLLSCFTLLHSLFDVVT